MAEVEALWLKEALRRDREIEAGIARLIPSDEFERGIQARFDEIGLSSRRSSIRKRPPGRSADRFSRRSVS